MAAYIIATVQILDPERFAEYTKSIAGLNKAHGGEPVVSGPVSEYLEGGVDGGERVVVVRFPDADAARGYIRSARYQEAKAKREGAAVVTMRIVEA